MPVDVGLKMQGDRSGGAFKGFAWLVSGRLASAVASIFSTAVLARLLTPYDFGVIAAAYLVLALANVIFDGAFGVNIVRKRELSFGDIGTTLSVAMALSALLMLMVIASSPLIQSFFGFPQLAYILVASSVTIPCKAMVAVSGAYLQREGRFQQLAAASFTGQFVGNFIFAVPLSLLGASVWTLVVAMVVSGLLEAVMVTRSARMPLRFAWDKTALSDIRATSLFSAANVMNWVANTSANTVIGRSLNATSLGYYSRAWKLMDLFVAATSTPLSRVLLPTFAKHRDDRVAQREAFLSVLHIVIPAYAIVSVLFTMQAPLIVELALGSQWRDTIPVAQLLFIALVPRCAFKVSEIFAVASGKALTTFMRQALYGILMLLGSVIGARYGVIGVAFGVSVAVTLFYASSMIYAIKIGRIGFLAVLGIHLRALLLAFCVAGIDSVSLSLLSSMAPLIAHFIAGMAAATTSLVLLAIAPNFFLGRSNVNFIAGVLRKRKFSFWRA